MLEQVAARWKALDTCLGLDHSGAEIWEQRAKALPNYESALAQSDQQSWQRLATYLARTSVPGFSLRKPGARGHGAPIKWTTERLAKLFADIEYLRRKTGLSVNNICDRIGKRKGYIERWGTYSGSALRKAYHDAKGSRRGLLFELELCGPAAAIPGQGGDLIAAAIKLHALQI